MSRIGKLPISVPAGVTITVQDTLVTVKGPKGVLTQEINPAITVSVEDGILLSYLLIILIFKSGFSITFSNQDASVLLPA